jgi:DNA topoisomerase-3
MPWLAINDKGIPSFTKGQKIKVSKVELYEVSVEPPA